MTNALKLKPCPFCGGEAIHNNGGDSVYGRLWWSVGCEACDIFISDKEVWDKSAPGMLDPMVPPKSCFSAWSTRHTPPEVQALVDALQYYARYGHEEFSATSYSVARDALAKWETMTNDR